jgi:hypothetical protein
MEVTGLGSEGMVSSAETPLVVLDCAGCPNHSRVEFRVLEHQDREGLWETQHVRTLQRRRARKRHVAVENETPEGSHWR